MTVKLAGIVQNSVVDGPGIRYVIFTQGCYHGCEGCHNPKTHDPTKGEMYHTEDIVREYLENASNYDGITLSGGEPFLQAEAMSDIITRIRDIKPDTEVICYTGYTYDQILKMDNYDYNKLLNNIDYLIDGKFEKDKATLDLPWRGSSNQRIIDVKMSMKLGEIIETELI